MASPFDAITVESADAAVFEFEDPAHCFGLPGFRGVHGGCILAMAVECTRRIAAARFPGHRHVMTCTGSFVAAARPGYCRATLEVLKATRNYVHAQTRLTQDGTVVHALSIVLGTSFTASSETSSQVNAESPLGSALRLLPLPSPEITLPNLCLASETTTYWNDGSLAGYGRHVDFCVDPASVGRMVAAEITGDNVGPYDGWIRMRPPQQHSFATTACLSDIASAGLQAFALSFHKLNPHRTLWDATLSLSVHWHQDPAEEDVTDRADLAMWIQIRVESTVLSFDRHEYRITMWKPDGALLCTASQLQVIKIMSKQ